MLTDQEIQEALDIARRLIRAGVPVFAAEPVEGAEGHYRLPPKWQQTIPSEVWLGKWKPGWGLGAVGGWKCDFLDGDPRHGSASSIMQLEGEGAFPLFFGEQATPSGGKHWVVAPTGLHKATGFMPGMDLQAGAEDGQGRGFVWISPTVRPSKDPADAGTLRPYRWVTPPNIELLEEVAEDARDSMSGIVRRIEEKRAAPRPRENAAGALTISADDPFVSASQVTGLTRGDRSFTLAEAQDFCRPALLRLQEAKVGEIEETANVAAATLSHFVPAFWDAKDAFSLLMGSLAHTAYDPNGPSDWRAEKFMPVLDGRRPPIDNWKAERKAEPPALPVVTVEAEPGQENLSTLEKLRARLVTAQELADSPTPDPLVHGLLDLDTEAWLIGLPGSLKSFVALDIAGHVAAGQDWQGHRVEKRPVLYVAAEGQGGMVLRTRAWMNPDPDTKRSMEGVTFLPYPVQVKSNDGQWEALTVLARELQPGLIVIDTQARVSVGLEENSATDMGVLISAIGMLKRATGACVLVIHHTGRNGGDARGSNALDGAQDTELKIERDSRERESLKATLKMDKQKDMAEDGQGIPLQFHVVDLGEDPRTGRALSSLVLRWVGDPWKDEADRAERERQDRQPWLPEFHALDEWRRKLLDTLYTFATLEYGMTKADLDGQMKAAWPKYNPRTNGPKKAWADLQEVKDSAGEPVISRVGGERWAVTHLLVRAALEKELGQVHGQVELPGLNPVHNPVHD